ncbi:NmrA family protein [Stemphylium lycopersici]|nr:NmrA family protein [Stemphylium lycopersici]
MSGLEKDFPAAEVVMADYADEDSLKAACRNMEGVFIITNGLTNERVAMTNMVAALKAANSAVNIIRLVVSSSQIYSNVARLMSEVWGEAVTYESSKEAFFEEYSDMGDMGRNYLWDFFEYEGENEVVWARNDFVERTLGRKPVSVRDWLVEHREVMLGH